MSSEEDSDEENRLSDDEIRKLWQDPDFPANHSGLTTFRNALQTKKNLYIGLAELKRILSEIPGYLDSLQRKKKFKRRPLQTDGYLNLMQIDTGFFLPYDG